MKLASVTFAKSIIALAMLICASFCDAQLAVTPSPKTGSPTTNILVSGSGFPANAEIYIYFDSSYEALVYANSSGSFSKIKIQVPANAAPGEHWISAQITASETGTQTPFNVNTNWPEFGFSPSGGRYNPYENVLDTSNVGSLEFKWSYYIGNYPGDVQPNSAAAVVNNVVYVGSAAAGAGALYALNATTGELLWKYPGDGAIGSIVSSPTFTRCEGTCPAAEILLFGAEDNNLYALNATTGGLLWKAPTGGWVLSSPVVAPCVAEQCTAEGVNQEVYFGSNDGNVYAVDLKNGAQMWKSAVPGANTLDSALAVANGVVYAGGGYNTEFTSTGGLYAFDSVTGTPLWSYEACEAIEAAPSVVNDFIFVGDDYGCLTALYPNSDILWTEQTGTGGILNLAAVNGTVYFGDYEGQPIAVSALSDALVWVSNPCLSICPSGIQGMGAYSSPAIANGVLYLGYGETNPNETVFLGSVLALNASSGQLLWSYPFSQLAEASPTVVNGMLFIQAEDGNMYAFGLPDPPQAPARPELNSLRRGRL
jgi:outer membrane protein assembly factor BamB